MIAHACDVLKAAANQTQPECGAAVKLACRVLLHYSGDRHRVGALWRCLEGGGMFLTRRHNALRLVEVIEGQARQVR